MDVVMQWMREMRALWLIGCAMIVALVCGCEPHRLSGSRSTPPDTVADPDTTADPEIPPPADPDTCVCTPVAPYGFDGPSLVGHADWWQDIHCPAEASRPGFSGLVIATGNWARECRITPVPECNRGAWVCVPPPPAGFELCIYRGEDFSCPHDYHRSEVVIESNGGQLTLDHVATLCCANVPPPG
jgi:hypothetical protein